LWISLPSKGDGVQTRVETASRETATNAVWGEACARLRHELSEGNFHAWFKEVAPIGLEDDKLVLAVPSPFAKRWIEDRYLDVVRRTVGDCAGREVDIVLLVTGAREPAPNEPSVTSADISPTPLESSAARPAFHPRYTFDSFVIGSSNRFAHAAALAAAEGPARAYNPLFIYGGAGLGKTHLLHAVGHYVLDYHPDLVVRYVSTEQFTNDYVSALQRRTIPAFHGRYRVADVLLVDDIQFLEGKEGFQEEFFHTFNALHPASQIVMTSDRPPKKISTLEERLRTRFEWGLITDIQPPDIETRLAILHAKSEAEGLAVPNDVMSFIASRIQTNIRELEGALIRVAAYASLTRAEISLELAQDVLRSLLPDVGEARVTPTSPSP
jgi:chromosomal replication initiator protein